jgi:protocatechuate 3,4-dioxygenase beta subunit
MMNIGVIDVNTCEPLPNVLVDIWVSYKPVSLYLPASLAFGWTFQTEPSHLNAFSQHANATGHYAGHPDPAPHLVDEQPASEGHRRGLLSAFPRTKDEETWLRAAQPTDENGVTEFTSIFPGYYTGRATRELSAPRG